MDREADNRTDRVLPVLAGVVLYEPDTERLMENLNAVLPQVQRLLLVDNHSADFVRIREKVSERFGTERLTWICLEENKGIAFALRTIMDYAAQEGFPWVLALDQDSVCRPGLVKEYLQLKSSTGTINILGAVTDGIHCGEGSRAVADWENCRFIMNGGTVNIANCGSDCIDSDDYGSMYLNGGLIDMKVTQNDGCGLKCDSIIRMTGDTIRMEVSGKLARGIKAGYHSYFSGGVIEGTVSGPASMGIHTNKVTKTTGTVLKGGDIYFQGTDVKLDVSGVSDAGDDCYAIAIDGDYHQSDGTVDVTVSNPASYGIDIIGNYIQSGGTVHVKVNDPDAIDNGFYAGGEETITGGTKTVE